MIWLLLFSYVAVAALLLNWNISVRAPLLVKMAVIALVTACYGFTYFGLREMQGWPTAAELPENFRLQWIMVKEPDKSSGTDGEIFFWIRHLDGQGQPEAEPRAYRLPFSEALAEQSQGALGKLQDGQTLNGYVSQESRDGEASSEEGESDRAGEKARVTDDALLRIEFRDVPRPTLPPKEVPAG